jgi:hypothetical protein
MQYGGDPGSLAALGALSPFARTSSRILSCAHWRSCFNEVSSRISWCRLSLRVILITTHIVMSLLGSVAAPIYGCVKGRSMERDNIQCISNALRTTAYLRSTTPYHPHMAPIFPFRQKQTKHAELQKGTRDILKEGTEKGRKRKR